MERKRASVDSYARKLEAALKKATDDVAEMEAVREVLGKGAA